MPVLTDAEIAKLMGWKGPGAYTVIAMRKVKAVAFAAIQGERAEGVKTERAACAQICHDRFMELEYGTDRSDPLDDRDAALQSDVARELRDEILARNGA